MAALATVPNTRARGVSTALPSVRGRVLQALVSVTIEDKAGNQGVFVEKRLFITNALLKSVSELRTSAEKGDYHSLWIDSPDGQATFIHVFADMFHVIPKIREGRYYSFEGTAHYGRNNDTRKLTRFLTLTKVVNVQLTAYDTPAAAAIAAEPEEEMPL
jgi:hypothetical protein